MTDGSGGAIVLPTTSTVPALPAIPTVALPTVPDLTAPSVPLPTVSNVPVDPTSPTVSTGPGSGSSTSPGSGSSPASHPAHDVESGDHDVDHAGRLPATLSSPNH